MIRDRLPINARGFTVHPLVKELLSDKTSREINRACSRADVSRMAVNGWLKEDAAPRITNLIAIGDMFGLELVWRRKELLPMRPMTQPRPRATDKLRMINKDKRIEIWDQTKMVAYVDDDQLTAIGKDGYAVPVCRINHRVEIMPKFNEWKAKQ